MSDSFKMPPVSVGQTVYYFRSEGEWKKYNNPDGKMTAGGRPKPAPGIVTVIGDRSIGLSVFTSGNGQIVIPMSGIKHVTDTAKSKWDLSVGGFWDYSDETKKIKAMEDIVGRLSTLLT